MPSNDAQGSHVVAISHRTLSWAVTEVVRHLADDTGQLKIASGEHLAAVLATAFLGIRPTSVDASGGPDLVFDVTGRDRSTPLFPAVREDHARLLDFEVKSLPGSFREHDAALNRAIAPGNQPRNRAHSATFVSVNDIMRGPGRTMLDKARMQLDRKAGPGHSRNVFLISHFFDHPIVEVMDAPLLAHHLAPLDDCDDLDTVWVLLAPHSLVVWSTNLARWTNLIFGASDPGEIVPGDDEGLDLLQYIDLEFQRQAGLRSMSPYVYTFAVADSSSDDAAS